MVLLRGWEIDIATDIIILSRSRVFADKDIPVGYGIDDIIGDYIPFTQLGKTDFPFAAVIPIIHFEIIVRAVQLAAFEVVIEQSVVHNITVFGT